MPPRDRSLPEGTDHIIDTNIDLGDTGTGGGTAAGGTGGTGSGTGTGGATAGGNSAFQFDKKDGDSGSGGSSGSGISGQVKEQLNTLKSQAGDRARSMADDGKRQATDLLQTLAQVVEDAAGSIEERLGGQYAGVGHRASDSIKSLASTLDDRSIDQLMDDARSFVQRSPTLAIGIAAVIGFAAARVVRSSVEEMRGGGANGSGGTGSDTGGTTGAMSGGGSAGGMGGTGTGGGLGGPTGGLNATGGAFGETGAGTAGSVGGSGTSSGAGSTGAGGSAPTY